MQTHLSADSPSLEIELLSSSWYGRGGDIITKGSLCPAFGEKTGGLFRHLQILNNPYAKAAYFGVAYSNPIQHAPAAC